MSDANTTGDSSELEALFDSIAGGVAATAPAPATHSASVAETRPSLMQQAREGDGSTDDSQDLQALFDSIAEKKAAVETSPIEGGGGLPEGSLAAAQMMPSDSTTG